MAIVIKPLINPIATATNTQAAIKAIEKEMEEKKWKRFNAYMDKHFGSKEVREVVYNPLFLSAYAFYVAQIIRRLGAAYQVKAMKDLSRAIDYKYDKFIQEARASLREEIIKDLEKMIAIMDSRNPEFFLESLNRITQDMSYDNTNNRPLVMIRARAHYGLLILYVAESMCKTCTKRIEKDFGERITFNISTHAEWLKEAFEALLPGPIKMNRNDRNIAKGIREMFLRETKEVEILDNRPNDKRRNKRKGSSQ